MSSIHDKIGKLSCGFRALEVADYIKYSCKKTWLGRAWVRIQFLFEGKGILFEKDLRVLWENSKKDNPNIESFLKTHRLSQSILSPIKNDPEESKEDTLGHLNLIPPEILLEILDKSINSIHDLNNLRLINRQFNNQITPWIADFLFEKFLKNPLEAGLTGKQAVFYLTTYCSAKEGLVLDFSDFVDQEDEDLIELAKHCKGITSIHLPPEGRLTFQGVHQFLKNCSNLQSITFQPTEHETIKILAQSCPHLKQVHIIAGFNLDFSPLLELNELETVEIPDFSSLNTSFNRKLNVENFPWKNLSVLKSNDFKFLDFPNETLKLIAKNTKATLKTIELTDLIKKEGFEALSQCENLENFSIKNFGDSFPKQELIDLFSKCTHLKSIRLDWSLKISEQDIQEVLENLPQDLESLLLPPGLGQNAAQILAKRCPNLKSIDIKKIQKHLLLNLLNFVLNL